MKNDNLPDNVKFYAYKLNENMKLPKGGSAQVEGMTFFNDKIIKFRERKEVLAKWIKTDKNPKGILDFAIYDPANPDQPITNKRKIYSLTKLMIMKRKQLREIADLWDLPVVRKSEKQLVQMLAERFEEEKLKEKEHKKKEKPKNKKPKNKKPKDKKEENKKNKEIKEEKEDDEEKIEVKDIESKKENEEKVDINEDVKKLEKDEKEEINDKEKDEKIKIKEVKKPEKPKEVE